MTGVNKEVYFQKARFCQEARVGLREGRYTVKS